MLDDKKNIAYSEFIMKNPILILGIGLCPLLAITNTFEKAYVMGIILLVTFFFSMLVIYLLNKIIKKNIFYLSLLIVSIIVAVIEYFLYTYVHDMYQEFGIYLPLIAINFIIIVNFAFSKISIKGKRILDSLKWGFGAASLLSLIGLIREILGNNTITLMDKISNFTGYMAKYQVLSTNNFIPNPFFMTTAGSFITFAIILSIITYFKNRGVKE